MDHMEVQVDSSAYDAMHLDYIIDHRNRKASNASKRVEPALNWAKFSQKLVACHPLCPCSSFLIMVSLQPYFVLYSTR